MANQELPAVQGMEVGKVDRATGFRYGNGSKNDRSESTLKEELLSTYLHSIGVHLAWPIRKGALMAGSTQKRVVKEMKGLRIAK